MVLAIALDPFAQQLLQYRTLTVFVDNPVMPGTFGTTIARAGRYSKGTEVRMSIVSINCKSQIFNAKIRSQHELITLISH